MSAPPSCTAIHELHRQSAASQSALLVRPDAHGRLPAELQHGLTNVNNYYFMQPGDSYEAPIYTAKQAYVAAVSTMQNNHPNDWVTVVPYSWPRHLRDRHARAVQLRRCPLGTNYTYATAALLVSVLARSMPTDRPIAPS